MDNALSEALLLFKCSKDIDIENFIHTKADDFERQKLCTVYCILDEDELSRQRFKIEAYFTLSHKTIDLNQEISGSKRRNIGHSKTDKRTHFVLIGQLGKYIEQSENGDCIASDITGKEILDMAFEVIYKAAELITCKCVLVECNGDEKVHKIHLDYGFTYLQFDGEHHQFYKSL